MRRGVGLVIEEKNVAFFISSLMTLRLKGFRVSLLVLQS